MSVATSSRYFDLERKLDPDSSIALSCLVDLATSSERISLKSANTRSPAPPITIKAECDSTSSLSSNSLAITPFSFPYSYSAFPSTLVSPMEMSSSAAQSSPTSKPPLPSIAISAPSVIGSGPNAPALIRSTSLGMPSLTRATSRSGASSAAAPADWRAFVTIEDRTSQRKTIKDAYKKQCPTYDELLEAVCAIDEELLFASSNSRTDYFRSGIDWTSRLQVKRRQMDGSIGLASIQRSALNENTETKKDGTSSEEPSAPKRKKKAEV